MNTKERKADVIVIGGGLMGCSCAYCLAKLGKKVLLFEARNIASGASGRNGGQVLQLEGRDADAESVMRRLTYTGAGSRMLKDLSRELDIDLEYDQCGSLDLATNQEEAEYLQGLVSDHSKAGDKEIEWIDQDKVRGLFPAAAESILGARLRPTDGIVNPFRLNHGFARAARRYRAQILTHTKVEEILIENGRIRGVRTAREVFEAPVVINAANAWASFLTKEISIFPLRMVAVLSESVPALQTTCPLEAEINGETLFTTTQTKSGNILMGGLGTEARTRADQYKEDVQLTEVQNCTKIITTFLPGLSSINIIRAWSGTMAQSGDGLPCIGPVPGTEGLILVAGFSNGMAYAPIVGKLVAEYISRGSTSLPIDVFDPARFYKKKIDWPEFYNYTLLQRFLGRLYS